MGEAQARANQRSRQIVEPTDDEKAAAKAAQTFGRSFANSNGKPNTRAAGKSKRFISGAERPPS